MNRMTNIIVGLAAGALLGGSATVHAAEVTVGADVASAYVFRGVTFNDGPVFQPYVDVAGFPGAFEGLEFGVWGNLDIDDYDGTLESGQFSEIDLYASYALPLEAVALSISYTEYTFPGAEDDADREIGLDLGLDVILAPYIAVYYGLDGGIEKDLYAEAGVGYGVELVDGLELELGALVGYLSPDEGDSGFHQYEVSAALAYGIFSASVAYIGQIDDDVLTDEAYDVEVVGTLGLAYTF